MATAVNPKTFPWGIGEAAAFFCNPPGWKAFADAASYAIEKNGRIESAHGILEQRIREKLDGPSWGLLTANYEEWAVRDAEGRFGKKAEPVFVAIQGGGMMLSSPERLQEAYTNRRHEEPLRRQEEISQVLAGMLPGGRQMKVYTLQELAKANSEQIPQVYAIVAPLRDVAETEPGLARVCELPKIGLFIIRAGHPLTAENYAKTLGKAGLIEYRNQRLSNLDLDKPRGNALYFGDVFSSTAFVAEAATFVAVCPGAEGSAPRNGAGTAGLLEVLARMAGFVR